MRERVVRGRHDASKTLVATLPAKPVLSEVEGLLLRCLVAPDILSKPVLSEVEGLLGQSLLGIMSPSNHPLAQVIIRI